MRSARKFTSYYLNLLSTALPRRAYSTPAGNTSAKSHSILHYRYYSFNLLYLHLINLNTNTYKKYNTRRQPLVNGNYDYFKLIEL